MSRLRGESPNCGEQAQGRVAAVVVAAGAGERLGAQGPKFLVDLGGKPLVFHALAAMENCPRVERIVLVVPPGREADARADVVERFSFEKVSGVVPGGDTRGESVSAGLFEIPADVRTVLVHDGARPFAPADLVLRVLEAADRFGAAIPGLESVDTLKRVEGQVTVATLDRSRIRRIQTPQGFHLSLVLDAYRRAREEEETASDDSTLVERTGATVRVVPGSPMNFKITTPEDLELAEVILAARG